MSNATTARRRRPAPRRAYGRLVARDDDLEADSRLAELDRLREEVVRLQFKIEVLEAALAARPDRPAVRRGLGSLIPTGPSSRVG